MRINPLIRGLAIIFLVLYTAGSLYTTLRGLLGLQTFSLITPILTLLAFTFACLHAAGRLGWKQALLLLTLSAGISLLFESVGVATGLVYGPYHYTGRLGPLFLGLVPYLIPVAWFMMMYPSFLMAASLQPRTSTLAGRLLAVAILGGLIMTAWDTVMDPVMVKTGHWVWESAGLYFGIPLQNYWGWWLTTFTVFAVFLLLRPRILDSLHPQPAGSELRRYDSLSVICYAVTAINQSIIAWLLGMPGPALVGLALMGTAVAAWMVSSRQWSVVS